MTTAKRVRWLPLSLLLVIGATATGTGCMYASDRRDALLVCTEASFAIDSHIRLRIKQLHSMELRLNLMPPGERRSALRDRIRELIKDATRIALENLTLEPGSTLKHVLPRNPSLRVVREAHQKYFELQDFANELLESMLILEEELPPDTQKPAEIH